MTTTTKFHAIMVPITQDFDRPVPGAAPFHHTQHRTLAAAARSLSKAINAWNRSVSAPSVWSGIVTPDGKVMSLRQAQGRTVTVRDVFSAHRPVEAALRAVAGIKEPVPFVDVCEETAYGATQRLSFQIRVF